MKEKGGEGATGSHCPSGHQEDCSSPGYARVNHRNGLGAGGNRVPEWGVTIRLMITPQGMHKPF